MRNIPSPPRPAIMSRAPPKLKSDGSPIPTHTADGVEYFPGSNTLVVAAGHGVYAHPVAIAEIKRILKQHLRVASPPM